MAIGLKRLVDRGIKICEKSIILGYLGNEKKINEKKEEKKEKKKEPEISKR